MTKNHERLVEIFMEAIASESFLENFSEDFNEIYIAIGIGTGKKDEPSELMIKRSCSANFYFRILEALIEDGAETCAALIMNGSEKIN